MTYSLIYFTTLAGSDPHLDVCSECGATVVDTAKHRDFHDELARYR